MVEVEGAAELKVGAPTYGGWTGVPVFEVEETSVLGIVLRELMKVAVSVEFDDTRKWRVCVKERLLPSKKNSRRV